MSYVDNASLPGHLGNSETIQTKSTIRPWAIVLALLVVFYTYIRIRRRSQKTVSSWQGVVYETVH